MTFKSAVKTFLKNFHLSPDSFFTSRLQGEFEQTAKPSFTISKDTAIKFFTALDAHDFTTATQMIEKSKDAALLHYKDATGADAMMHMSQDGNLTAGHFLIAKGAAVREADNKGATALMYAGRAIFNSEKMIDLLIDAGASLSAKNNNGDSVIMDMINHSGIKGATHILKNYGAGKGGVTLDFSNPSLERALAVATMECEFEFCALVETQRKAQASTKQAAAPSPKQ